MLSLLITYPCVNQPTNLRRSAVLRSSDHRQLAACQGRVVSEIAQPDRLPTPRKRLRRLRIESLRLMSSFVPTPSHSYFFSVLPHLKSPRDHEKSVPSILAIFANCRKAISHPWCIRTAVSTLSVYLYCSYGHLILIILAHQQHSLALDARLIDKCSAIDVCLNVCR